MEVPSREELFLPTIRALQALGGSGTIEEIYAEVIEILGLPDGVVAVQHGDTGRSEVEYRLAWSRTYLKNCGLLENSRRGVWALTAESRALATLDPKEVVRRARLPKLTPEREAETSEPEDEIFAMGWEAQLHKILLGLHPSAFERVIQRMLRESGFIQVEVTGRSGDGGIDGIGIARISGFLSFQVLFQCKRYQSAVTPSQVRDFRGAMQGRTDKGLFITTGTFTREAMKEATRDGAPPIDLIDGEQLVRRLKDLRLGVRLKVIETVEVDPTWFESL